MNHKYLQTFARSWQLTFPMYEHSLRPRSTIHIRLAFLWRLALLTSHCIDWRKSEEFRIVPCDSNYRTSSNPRPMMRKQSHLLSRNRENQLSGSWAQAAIHMIWLIYFTHQIVRMSSPLHWSTCQTAFPMHVCHLRLLSFLAETSPHLALAICWKNRVPSSNSRPTPRSCTLHLAILYSPISQMCQREGIQKHHILKNSNYSICC